MEEHSYVYFVHSYYLEAADPSIVTATTEYGTLIHASVEKGNIFCLSVPSREKFPGGNENSAEFHRDHTRVPGKR